MKMPAALSVSQSEQASRQTLRAALRVLSSVA
jgi:hypothetical protein